MAEQEKRSFADEVSTLGALLQQAGNKLNSLRNLHDAEVREAKEDLASKVQESKGVLSAGGQEATSDSHIVASFKSAPNALPADDECSEDEGLFRIEKLVMGRSSEAVEAMRSNQSKSSKCPTLRPLWESNVRHSDTVVELKHSVEIARFGSYSMAVCRNEAPHRSSSFLSQLPIPSDMRSVFRGFCGVFHPIGPFRLFWNAVCFLLILYDFVIIPLSAFDIEDLTAVEVLEWIVTICWTFDIWMSFRTGYLMGLHLEMRPKKIAIQYIKTWLIWDLMIVILEWFNRVAAGLASASLLKITRIKQTFKIVRLFRLGRLGKLRTMRHAMQDQTLFKAGHLAFSIAFLSSTLLLIIHIAACLWYTIGTGTKDGWTTYDGYEDEHNRFFFYVASFRWVIAQINGRIDINVNRNMQERLYTCATGVTLGIFYQAVFISFVTKTMLDLNELFSEHARRQRFVRTYLEMYPLPPMLTAQVRISLNEYKDVGKQLQKEKEFMQILPTHLQTDVLFEVRSAILQWHHFFGLLCEESMGVMRLVCQHVVQPIPASKAEMVFDKGDVCSRMLFMDKITTLYGEPTDFIAAASKSKKTNQTMKTLHRFVTKASDVSDTSDVDMQNKTLIDSWISEPALWVEWSNQGRLVSNEHGLLFEVDATPLAKTLKQDRHTFQVAVMYAKTIADELGKNQIEELSDILPFKVEWNI